MKHSDLPNQTDPHTPKQWLRYVLFAVIAIFLVYVMVRIYVL
jgi:hypothetical protein